MLVEKIVEISGWFRINENNKKRTIQCVLFIYGRGSRTRTHINGFGDRCSTIELYPYRLLTNNIIVLYQLQPVFDIIFQEVQR